MDIAVTGASGFLGRCLCSKLHKLGHNVFEYNSKNLDITKPVVFPESVEILYHLAANANVYWAKQNPSADFRLNALGTLNILEADGKIALKKIIYTSSVLVYENLINCREDKPVGPNEISGPYGFNKLISEYYIRLFAKKYNFDYVILRPGSYYGPEMKKNPVLDIVNGFLNEEKICLFHHVNSQIDFIYIEDVAEALIMAMNWRNETVNVGSGKSISMGDIYKAAKTIFGKEIPIAYSTNLVKITIDNSRLKGLGWRQRYSFEEGLRRTIDEKYRIKAGQGMDL